MKKERHPLPDSYADYLRKAEIKDPDTYKGYGKACLDSNNKVKPMTFHFGFKKLL